MNKNYGVVSLGDNSFRLRMGHSKLGNKSLNTYLVRHRDSTYVLLSKGKLVFKLPLANDKFVGSVESRVTTANKKGLKALAADYKGKPDEIINAVKQLFQKTPHNLKELSEKLRPNTPHQDFVDAVKSSMEEANSINEMAAIFAKKINRAITGEYSQKQFAELISDNITTLLAKSSLPGKSITLNKIVRVFYDSVKQSPLEMSSIAKVLRH